MNYSSTPFFAKAIFVFVCCFLIFSCNNPVNGPSGPANHRIEGENFIASDAKLQLTLPAGSWKSSIDTAINSTTYALWSATRTITTPTILSALIGGHSGTSDMHQIISETESQLVANGATIISSDTIRVNGKQLGEISLTMTSSGILTRENILLAINNNMDIVIIYGIQSSVYSNYANEYNSIKASIILN